MNVLLFGGAFDPPHIGHKQILELALQNRKWDKLIIIPTATPGHKQNCLLPYIIRKELAKISFSKLFSDIEFCDFEYLQIDKISYSYSTLFYLKEKYPDANLTFLIGQDNIRHLKQWENYTDVINATSFLAFLREEFDEYTKTTLNEIKNDGAQIDIIENQPVVISSSEIRDNINDKNVSKYLDDDVFNMINKYSLYSLNEDEKLDGMIKLLLEILVDEKRRVHSYNVKDVAVELAKVHNVDTRKAEISALLHDVMKRVSEEEMLKRCYDTGECTDKEKPFKTLHGFAGADFSKRELKIFDEDILWAIKSHTCARAGMSDLEKIIYLSDMISKERVFDEKDELTRLSFENLDKAVLRGLELSMKWLIEKNKDLDKDSTTAFEYYKRLINEGEK